MAKELLYSFDICWGWQLDNEFNLCFVNFNALLGDDVPKDNPLVYHEMAFLLVEHQVFLNASVQHNFQIDLAFVKHTSINGDIIHKDFHNTFHHITENA